MEKTLPSTTRTHLVLRPGAGWQALDLREIWQYRDLLLTLAVRDIKLRYRQTALGALWVVLLPLMTAGIFSFIFGRLDASERVSGGMPLFLFQFSGLLAWNAFASTLTRTSGSLVGNAHLIAKVYFPRLILPLSQVFSTLVDFGVALGMAVVLMIAHKAAPGGAGILLLPLWLALALMLAMGIGLLASAVAVTYRDVGYVMQPLTQLWLFLTPVLYTTEALIPAHLRTLYYLNPLASLVEAFRWSLLGTKLPPLWSLAWAALVVVVVFLIGAFAFRRMERKFADVI